MTVSSDTGATPPPNPAASGNGNGSGGKATKASRGGRKGENHTTAGTLEDRYERHRKSFLDSLEKLYPVAKRLKNDADKSPLPDQGDIQKTVAQLGKSYAHLHAARVELDERKTNSLIRSNQDLIGYLFAGLPPEKLLEARTMITDGKAPEEVMKLLSNANKAGANAPQTASAPAPAASRQAGG